MATAQYLIVQHVADLFRREPRNVGVVVKLADQMEGRFFGEVVPGDPIDRRKIRALPHPSVYAQWVRYWRRTISKAAPETWDILQKTTTDHYRIVNGGNVDGLGDDNAIDVANYLYTSLVSEGGIAAAIGGPDEVEETIRLVDSVTNTFKSLQLLVDEDRSSNLAEAYFPHVANPIRRNTQVRGRTISYNPSFVQEGDQTLVMEPLNITVKRDKNRLRERAAYASFMFKDIRDAEGQGNVQAISIVDATSDEEREPHAADALKVLRTASRVINWQSASERQELIGQCRSLAMAG